MQAFPEVTETPTLVDNDDDDAYDIKEGVYRDNVGAVPSTASPSNGWGPGFFYAADDLSDPATTFTLHLDDQIEHEPFRQVLQKITYWKIVCDTFTYYLERSKVIAMSATAPTL